MLNIAEEKEQHPSQILVTETDNNATKAYTTQIENIENWDCRNKEAKAQITLTLSDKPLSRVIHVGSAADAWNKLNYRYESQGYQTIAQLINEIFRTTFTNDSSLEPQMNTICHKVLLSTSKDKLSSLVIINYILIEKKSQKSQSTSQTTFIAYLGKGKGKAQDKEKGG